MELPKAIKIIKLLADGKHPLTNEPDVIRALNKIIEALSSIEEKIKKQRDLPERVGKPWSENEDQALIKEFDSGSSIDEMVVKHQRTRGAVRSRLVKLGKISLDDRSPR